MSKLFDHWECVFDNLDGNLQVTLENICHVHSKIVQMTLSYGQKSCLLLPN